MTRVVSIDQIKDALTKVDLRQVIEDGFAAYSRREVVVPPVGELIFENPPGEAHIKYGYIKNDDYYVIKVASGFYNNPELGLASSQGLMLIFCQKTGKPEAVLLDDGYLTDIRTAAAGAVVSKFFAPESVECIGIIGAGTQGKFQLEHLLPVVDCKDVLVWTPSDKERDDYLEFFENAGLNIRFAPKCADVASQCNLIVTTTPSKTPLLKVDDIQRGTHITAMGSDTADKIELAPEILGSADMVVADSLCQSETRGEIFRAVQGGKLKRKNVRELGDVISKGLTVRTSDSQITVVDLTGVAVQDIQIAKAVYQNIRKES